MKRFVLLILMLCLIVSAVQADLGYLTEYNSSLKFLAHFNGGNGSTTTTDSSSSGYTITFNDGGANNQISGAQRAFGESSYYLNDEAIGRGLSVSGGTAFTIGTGNYTRLFWYKHTSGKNPSTIFYGSSAFNIYYNGVDILYFTAGAQQITLPTDGNWHQIVETRTGTGSNEYKIYVDGVVNITGTDSTDIGSISSWDIGNTYNVVDDSSYIDEYAIWTTDIPISKLWPQPFEVNSNTDVMTSFSQFNTGGTAPYTTYLYDTSTNRTYGDTDYWMFGDGNTSTQTNVFYTWNVSGTYSVNHSVSNSVKTSWQNKSNLITVGSVS